MKRFVNSSASGQIEYSSFYKFTLVQYVGAGIARFGWVGVLSLFWRMPATRGFSRKQIFSFNWRNVSISLKRQQEAHPLPHVFLTHEPWVNN